MVAPYAGDEAFGVPLYGYFNEDGGFTYSAVPALDSCATLTDAQRAQFARPWKAVDLTLILHELDGAAPVVRDNVMAYLAHKTIEAPPGTTGKALRVDSTVGYLTIEGENPIPAVLVATCLDASGVLSISRFSNGAAMHLVWVKPGSFTPDAPCFAALTASLTLADFLSGLRGQRALLAVAGLAVLLQDSERVTPDIVTMAMLERITGSLPMDNPARSQADRLICAIEERYHLVRGEGVAYYLSNLCALRSSLAVIIRARKAGTEARFVEATELPSFVRLVDAMVAQLHSLVVLGGVDRYATDASIRDALCCLVATVSDRFTNAMTTERSHLVSAMADLASHPVDAEDEEGQVVGHLRRLLHLLGTFEWISYRTFDACVMYAMTGYA